MKKYIILSSILLLTCTTLFSQCWKNINTKTTNPYISGSNNTFDWTQETATIYLQSNWNTNMQQSLPMQITLPMYSQSSSTFQNLNCLDYQSMPVDEKDYDNEDGWELLIKDFGEPSPIDKTIENPMYAIYNRYTSKIRVFIMLTTKASSLNLTGAYVEMSFPKTSRKTAIFQHANPIGFPIVFFEKENPMRVPNYLENKNFYWFSAEFPIAYDPCTCVLNDLKKSQLTFRLIANEDEIIEAKINGTLIQNAVSNTQPSSTDKSFGLIANDAVLTNGIAAAKKGFEGFTTFEAYRKSFNKGLDEVDGFYKQIMNNKLEKAFPNGITIGNQTVAPDIDYLKTTKEGVKFLSGANYDATAIKNFKGLAQALPYVGSFIGLVDYFSNLDKQKSVASPTPTPTKFTVDLSFNGTIKKENPINSYTFYTPGTQDNNSPNAVPIYNNILGVINILNIPPLEFVEYTPISKQGGEFPIDKMNDVSKSFIPNIRQYRLTDDLKYVVNPASNLEVISAEAVYVLEFGSGKDEVVFGNSPQNNVLWRDVDMMPVEFINSTTDITSLSIPERMEKQGWELDNLTKDYFSYVNGTGGPQKGLYRIRTPYCPIQCFKNVAFNLYNHPNEDPNLNTNEKCCRNKAPKLILKVIFKLAKSSSAIIQNKDVITQVMAFDMTGAVKKAEKSKNKYNNLHYVMDGEKLNGSFFPSFFTKQFENFPVFPTVINAPQIIELHNQVINYDIYAQNKIIINDQVFINNGVSLYAGNEINSNASVNFHSPAFGNVSYNIGVVNRCNKEIIDAHETVEEITSKCNSSKYQENALELKPTSVFDNDSNIFLKRTDFDFEIAPNPNQGAFNIISTLNGEYEIYITDLAGKLLFKEKIMSQAINEFNPKSLEIFKISCNNCLSTGIYLVKVRLGDKFAVKKVLIEK